MKTAIVISEEGAQTPLYTADYIDFLLKDINDENVKTVLKAIMESYNALACSTVSLHDRLQALAKFTTQLA